MNQSASSFLSSLDARLGQEAKGCLPLLREFSEKRLWHQLGETLLSFYAAEENSSLFVETFFSFVSCFEAELDPNTLVRITRAVCKVLSETSDEQAAETMHSTLQKVCANENASAAAALHTAFFLARCGREEQAESLVDSLKEIKNKTDVPRETRSAFYRAKAMLAEKTGCYGGYVTNTLHRLSCLEMDEARAECNPEQINKLCISALLAEDIFSFGELVQHQIGLLFSEECPLLRFLAQFHAGAFEVYPEFEEHIQPLLGVQALPGIKQKIRMMALARKIKEKTRSEGAVLPLRMLADELSVAQSDVEALLIGCFISGLLAGKISQKDGAVAVTWIKPGPMDAAQTAQLKSDFDGWRKRPAASGRN